MEQANDKDNNSDIAEKTDASDAGTPEDASNNIQKSQAQSTSGKAKGKKSNSGDNKFEEPESDESSGSTADQGGR